MSVHQRYVVFLILVAGILAAPYSYAEPETVDRIAVVVGDEIILASELANQIQMMAFQTGQRPKNEDEIRRLQKQVVEQMISDRLFLAEAKKDTSITVTQNDVQQALDDHIARVISNFGSEDEFLQALSQEGLTLRDLERQYESDIENNLLRQRYIQKKLYSVSISRKEVEEFYTEFRDSIPKQPEGMKLAHILLKVTPSKEIEDSTQNFAAELRQRVLDGADFATLSTQYSSLGAGENGGDLGWVERDDVVPEFARAAFKLSEGEVSGVVRTPFGYHVIKCEGQRGEQYRLRHILLVVEPSVADTMKTLQLADSLLHELRENQADFAEMAKVFSNDDDTRAQGGELGWFAVDQLPSAFSDAVSGWDEPGDIRGPVKSRFGHHILKLLDYQAEKVLTLDSDYDRIKELARQDKTGRMVDEWIAEIKSRSYIDYRIEDMQ